MRDNRIYVDKQSICDQLNNHFINVGNDLADKLPKHDIDPSVYLDRTMTANSFMFRGICPTEVYDEVMSLKIDKSALDIPINLLVLVASPLQSFPPPPHLLTVPSYAVLTLPWNVGFWE